MVWNSQKGIIFLPLTVYTFKIHKEMYNKLESVEDVWSTGVQPLWYFTKCIYCDKKLQQHFSSSWFKSIIDCQTLLKDERGTQFAFLSYQIKFVCLHNPASSLLTCPDFGSRCWDLPYISARGNMHICRRSGNNIKTWLLML